MISITNHSNIQNNYNCNIHSYGFYLLLYYLFYSCFNFITILNSRSCSTYTSQLDCQDSIIGSCEWKQDQCVCTSTVAQDIVILMDASGSLGDAAWQIEKDFVRSLIESAIPSQSRVALVRFSTESTIIHNLDDSQNRSYIYSVLDNTTYPRGYTHIKDAVEDALYIFKTQSDLDIYDRLMMLITDGNPVPTAQSPCNLTTALTKHSIDTFIVGVGSSWTQAKIDCIVDDPDNDIISVSGFDSDEFDAVRDLTDEFLCPDAVSVSISEVKPVPGLEHKVTFLELYNTGEDLNLSQINITLDGLFSGYIQLTRDSSFFNWDKDLIWESDTFLVLFDDSSDILVDPECRECLCNLTSNYLCYDAIYIACNDDPTKSKCKYNSELNGQAVTATNWYQSASAYDYTGIPYIFNITYGQGYSTWSIAPDGYTYFVTDIENCNSKYGYCWDVSCSYYGTPGDFPLDTCNITCYQDACRINGDSNAICNTENDICDCTTDDAYYVSSTGTTCEQLESPLTCTVYTNKSASLTESEGELRDQADIEWDRVDVSPYIVYYRVEWHDSTDGGSTQYFDTPSNQRYTFIRGIAHIGYNTSVATVIYDINDDEIVSEYTVCDVITMAPTLSPTPAPTYALPPIKNCDAHIISKSTASKSRISIEWTEANTSSIYTYNDDQFWGNYRVFIFKIINNFVQSTYWTALDIRGLTYVTSATLDSKITDLDSEYYISVSPVIQDAITGDDMDELETLMIEQATYCDITSNSPTAAPTNVPTMTPTDIPTNNPTYIPTMSPTYAFWDLDNCIIEITNKQSNQWTMTWDEYNNNFTDTPLTRQIWVYKDSQLMTKLNKNTFSPQSYQSITINALTTEIKLIVYQLINGNNEEALIPSSATICDIITMSPTVAPTNAPTMSPTTKEPTLSPTNYPTFAPTPAPTYRYSVAQCIITVEDSEIITLTFDIPDFNYPFTPADATDINYRLELVDPFIYPPNGSIEWNEAFLPLNADNENATVTQPFDIKSSGYNALNLTSHYYQLSIIWVGSVSLSNKFKSTSKECEIVTKSPTNAPTSIPTNYPTLSPTYQPPGVYLADDVCSGIDRCDECNEDINNYLCTTSDGSGILTIDEAIISDESKNAKDYFEVKRLPYEYDHDVRIYWQFKIPKSANDSGSSKDDISPWQGYIDIKDNKESEWITTKFILEDSEELDDDSEIFELWLTSCQVLENKDEEDLNITLQDCSVIFPFMTYVIITNTAASTQSFFEEFGTLPDFVWVLLLAGAFALGTVGWGFYTFNKNRKMQAESTMQDIQPVSLMQGNVTGDLDANQAVALNA